METFKVRLEGSRVVETVDQYSPQLAAEEWADGWLAENWRPGMGAIEVLVIDKHGAGTAFIISALPIFDLTVKEVK